MIAAIFFTRSDSGFFASATESSVHSCDIEFRYHSMYFVE